MWSERDNAWDAPHLRLSSSQGFRLTSRASAPTADNRPPSRRSTQACGECQSGGTVRCEMSEPHEMFALVRVNNLPSLTASRRTWNWASAIDPRSHSLQSSAMRYHNKRRPRRKKNRRLTPLAGSFAFSHPNCSVPYRCSVRSRYCVRCNDAPLTLGSGASRCLDAAPAPSPAAPPSTCT